MSLRNSRKKTWIVWENERGEISRKSFSYPAWWDGDKISRGIQSMIRIIQNDGGKNIRLEKGIQ